MLSGMELKGATHGGRGNNADREMRGVKRSLLREESVSKRLMTDSWTYCALAQDTTGMMYTTLNALNISRRTAGPPTCVRREGISDYTLQITAAQEEGLRLR